MTFSGFAALNEAQAEADNGDVAKSLELVKQAFADCELAEPLIELNVPSLAVTLLRLSRKWQEKNVAPDEVVDVLLEVVLPSMPEGAVFLFPGQWQLIYDATALYRVDARLKAPESLSEEFVRWTLLAKKSKALQERLKARLASAKWGTLARVVAVQLTVAENDPQTAIPLLDALAKEARTTDTSQSLYTMCLAVMAALRDEKSEPAGLGLFEAVLDRAVALPGPEAGLKGNSSRLRLDVARRHFQAGRKDDALRLVKAAVEKKFDAITGNFNKDYLFNLRRVSIDQAAALLLDGGLIAEALEILAPVIDDPGPKAAAYSMPINVPAMLGRELEKLSPQKRFELLRQWIIPRGERKGLRDVTGYVPFEFPLGQTSDPLPRAGLLRDLYGTGWHFLATAKELGKLNDVLQDLAVLPLQTPQVEAMRVLGAVLRDGSADNKAVSAQRTAETTGRLQKLLQTTTSNVPKWEVQDKAPFPTLTLLTASEAGRHPEWRGVARNLVLQLIEHSKRIHHGRPRAHASMALAELSRLGNLGNPQTSSAAEWARMSPQHWVEAGFQASEEHAGGTLPGVWCALEGMVQHVTGAQTAGLSYEFPLSGKFEVQFDSREAGWAEGNVSYGGAQFWIDGYSGFGILSGKGQSGSDRGPSIANLIHKEPWNHYSIQVDGDVVRYRANGQVVHVDKPGSSVPWLTLGTDWGSTAVFRNFKLIGTPSIPREISLFTDNRLRGWIATHFRETRGDALLQPPSISDRSSGMPLPSIGICRSTW